MAHSLPKFTKSYHNTTYAGIDPTRAELSAEGRTVVITGGAGGVGSAIARSFALAKASNIILIGRTESTLKSAVSLIQTEVLNANVHHVVADITDKAAITNAMSDINKQYGDVNILINNAGYMPYLSPIASADFNMDDWWKAFEINVRGSLNVTQSFLSHIPSTHEDAKDLPVLIDITAGLIHVAPWPEASGYTCAKLAATKMFDYVRAENKDRLRLIHVHPGLIESEMTKRMALELSLDDPRLAGDFVVWASSREAAFLEGKYVWVNWDVEELKSMKEEIQGNDALLTLGLTGWPRAE